MDGSQFDGELPEWAVFGWAFAITRGDEVIGLARGVPPEYVRSIPAAEAWCLAMATMYVGLGGRYVTDCKSVKDIARGGLQRATAGGQLNARIWAITFAHTDGETPMVEWMPSHTSRAAIGTVKTGDGSFLTERQWRFNQLVDRHAKEAASAVRHPAATRQALYAVQMKVAAMAQWVAKATFAANNGREPPYRDSEPSAVRRIRQGEGGERRKGRGRREIIHRPVQLGGHDLASEEGKWKCRHCKKTSGKLEALAGGRCGGSAAALWARRAKELGAAGGSDGAGHLRAAKGDFTWCIRCGAYAVAWAVGLAAPCPGAPLNQSQKRVRNRLAGGRHPRTNEPIAGELVLEVPGSLGTGNDEEPSGSGGEVGTSVGAVFATGLRQLHDRSARRVSWGGKPRSSAGYLRRPGGRRGPFEETFAASGGEGLGVVLGQGEGWQMEGVNELSRKRKASVQEQRDKILLALEEGERSVQHDRARKNLAQSSGMGEGDGNTTAAATEGGAEPQISRRQLVRSLREEVEKTQRRRF